MVAYVRDNPSMYAYYKSRGHLIRYKKELIQYGRAQAIEIKRQAKAERLHQSITQSRKLSEEINTINERKRKKII